MTMNLKLAVVVFTLGMIGSVAAQNKTIKSSEVHHTQIRRKRSSVALPADSKKLNSDLARLEGQTSRTLASSRRAPTEKAVPSAKGVNQQERRSNPPINFNSSGKGGKAAHGGTRAKSAQIKAGPRMR